ncbi:MAG: hypothetical protein ACREQ9_24730, partial [Candidatus Binatia bacterium]
ASADYDSHPEIRPEARCGRIPPGIEDRRDPGGVASIHCQPLFWDLPAATRLGQVAAATPVPGDRRPWYPNGMIDRPPPMFILDRDGDGASDDGQGYESAGPGRARLCVDPDEVPWWKPLADAQGKPVVGPDPVHGVTGPHFTIGCRRGTRLRFGPWQIGRSRERADDIAEGVMRIENSARLDRDVEFRGLDARRDGRVEWHTGTEFYAHFATHHAVCWNPENSRCNNPKNPWAASDRSQCHAGYQEVADGPEAPGGTGACYAGDQDTRCRKPDETGESVRDYTMLPGRTYFEYGPGEAEIMLEDQLRDCYQHLVPELPPRVAYHVEISSFGLAGQADYRLQTGGLPNVSGERREGVAPGEVIGGAVGELVIQYFTEAFTAPGFRPATPSTSVRKGGLSDFLERHPHVGPTPAAGPGKSR